MRLAIMQPYLFPYIGYWQLIANSDMFIFFDVVQYNKKSWMNRNRILHPEPSKGFQYISVPIRKHSRGTLIRDAVINNNIDWRNGILGKLTIYKKLHAPHYDETIDLLESIFDHEYDKFLELSIESTKEICGFLEIELKYKKASNIEFNRDLIQDPGDWALAISKAMCADSYINPHGGYEIFCEEKYNSEGIDLRFIKPDLKPYKQSRREKFESGLSIIDLLMFLNKDEVRKVIFNNFRELSKNNLKEVM